MNEEEPGSVQHYRRRQLEPEIAAMSVETAESDQPVLIVNIDDPAARTAIRKVITLVGAALGGLAEWLKNVAHDHSTVTTAAGTALVTATAITVVPALVVDGEKYRPPPVAIERVVTLTALPGPAATVTVTQFPERSTVAVLPTRRPSQSPVPPTRLPSPEATPERSARTSSPVKTPARQTPTPKPQASDDELAATPSTVTPTRPPPTETPAPEPEPPPTIGAPGADLEPTVAAACGGIIRVDLDPLPDLCLLG